MTCHNLFSFTGSAAMRLALVAALSLGPAVPAYAWGNNWNSGGNTNNDVDPTGIIHPVYMVGNSFFPDTIHAQPGDEIKFYNLAYTTQRVKADDNSWQSDYLSKDDSWSLIVQEDTELQFRKSGFNWGMYGEIKLQDPPSAVDYGDLVDAYGNIVGKDGESVGTATGLGYTLAGVGGTLRDLGNGLTSITGNDPKGLALGLTTSLGLGNN